MDRNRVGRDPGRARDRCSYCARIGTRTKVTLPISALAPLPPTCLALTSWAGTSSRGCWWPPDSLSNWGRPPPGWRSVLGVPLGAIVALLGHRPRDAGRALINIFLSFPSLLLALIIVTIVGIGTNGAVIAVGIGSAPYFARLTESLASAAVGREYVACARVIGIKPRRLVFRYILPNVAEPIVIMGITYIAGAIIDVSALSFLGVGVQPPAYDWGALLNAGLQNFYPDPAGALGPAVMIAITALAVNFLAEGLARALNPALWTAAKELRPGALRSRKLARQQ